MANTKREEDFKIHASTNYKQFKLLGANREIREGHLAVLDKAFEENGNITRVSPIIVNENFEVIDGQHRLKVCERRGIPVFYVVTPGLNVSDARKMNILHRRWEPIDYARSYAVSDPNYRMYLELQEEYGTQHQLLLIANNGGLRGDGLHAKFRAGEFVIQDLDKTRKILDLWATVRKIMPKATAPTFYMALSQARLAKGFKEKRLFSHLEMYGPQLYQQLYSMEDNLRQVEMIYNYRMKANRTRLF